MSEPLEPNLSALTLSAVASPVRTSVLRVDEQASVDNNLDSGASSIGSFASYDRGTSSWRTAQTSWLTDTGWTSLSGSWPQSGMTRSGIAYPLPPLVPRTRGSGSSLWPPLDRPNGGRGIPRMAELSGRTITTVDRKTGKRRKVQLSLKHALSLFPTLTARDASGRAYQYNDSSKKTATLTLAGALRLLPTLIARDRRTFLGAKRMPNLLGTEPLTVVRGGTLNPRWCEWFMGYPQDWCVVANDTPRKSARSATPSSRRSRSGSQNGSARQNTEVEPQP